MSPRWLFGFAVVAAMTLSSCDGTAEHPPLPISSTRTTTTAPLPSTAPPVDSPVDLSAYSLHPCPLLNAQQLAQLEIPTEEQNEFQRQDDGSWYCEWSFDTSIQAPPKLVTYSLTVYVSGDPLTKAYQTGIPSMFEELTIRGLPAVRRYTGEFQCEVVVGTGNGQGFTMFGRRSLGFQDRDLCRDVVTAAEWVVDAVRK